MNLKIEFRYAVLISLLTLLWLSLEFLIGIHDKYIQYEKYLTLLALGIPVFCTYLAIKEKIKQREGQLTFKAALFCGIFIAIFAAVLSLPAQFAFYKLINPAYFSNMIEYSISRATMLGMDVREARAEAEMYFNLSSSLMQCFFGTLFFGTIIALIMAWRMRTVK